MAENDLLKRLLDAGVTFTALTQARAEELVRDLVRTGAVQAEQAQASVDELVERSRRNRERLVGAVRSEIDDQLAKLDLATRDDLDRMVQRFADVAATLIAQVSPDREAGKPPSPSSVPATSTSDRGPSGATSRPAKKSSPAEKTAAKKTTSKKQAPAEKTAAKRTTSKKSSPAEKTAAKKTTSKQAPAKKSPAKKAAEKTTGDRPPSSGR